MNRRDTVIRLAPVAPPCFSDRLTWLEFLASAAEGQRTGKGGPLDLRQTEPRFNHRFDFCAGCTAKHAISMQTQDRCKPWWLEHVARAQAALQEPTNAA